MKNISDLTYYYNTQCPLHHRSAAMCFCGFLMFFFYIRVRGVMWLKRKSNTILSKTKQQNVCLDSILVM